MKNSAENLTDQQKIHAFLDGMLSPEEEKSFEERLMQDDALKEELCEIRKVKQSVNAHYKHIQIPPYEETRKKLQQAKRRKNRLTDFAVAASVLIAITAGVVQFGSENSTKMGQVTQVAEASQTQSHNYLLHIDSDDPQKQRLALEKAQHLVKAAYQAGQPVQVEIVANNQGIHLFDANDLDKLQILKSLAQYDNVKLLACKNAIANLKSKGEKIKLMAPVIRDRAALDEIVGKMQQGWHYQKI
jgi:intracellular sulfur oxidation DsrE/DsrF family protein